MCSSQQYDKAEAQLARGMRDQMRASDSTVDCPTQFQLHAFLKGACAREEASIILGHIGRCSYCADLIKRVDTQKVSRKRMLVIAIAFAAALFMAIGSHLLQRPQPYSGTVTIDLRELSINRGVKTSQPEIVVSRQTSEMRLILPIGSEGHYDCVFFEVTSGVSKSATSADAVIVEGKVILELPVRLETAPVGFYKLELKRGTVTSRYLIRLI